MAQSRPASGRIARCASRRRGWRAVLRAAQTARVRRDGGDGVAAASTALAAGPDALDHAGAVDLRRQSAASKQLRDLGRRRRCGQKDVAPGPRAVRLPRGACQALRARARCFRQGIPRAGGQAVPTSEARIWSPVPRLRPVRPSPLRARHRQPHAAKTSRAADRPRPCSN